MFQKSKNFDFYIKRIHYYLFNYRFRSGILEQRFGLIHKNQRELNDKTLSLYDYERLNCEQILSQKQNCFPNLSDSENDIREEFEIQDKNSFQYLFYEKKLQFSK